MQSRVYSGAAAAAAAVATVPRWSLTAEFDPPRRADCVLGIPCKAVGSTRGKQVTTTLIDVIRELMNMILISFI